MGAPKRGKTVCLLFPWGFLLFYSPSNTTMHCKKLKCGIFYFIIFVSLWTGYHTCNHDTHFECSDNICIPKFKRCDGYKDCATGHDEMNCEQPCEPNQFKCKFGECVDKSRLCDYFEDCSNGADERNCGTIFVLFSCLFLNFPCFG